MNQVYKNKSIILPLSLFISLRFSYKHHSGNMVSIVSMISVVGIMLGVAILIIGMSAMNGFEHELNNRILKVIPHGEIESINQPWKNWLQALQKISHLRNYIVTAPYINFTGLIENRSNLRLIRIRGIDLNLEEKLSALPQFVQNNAWVNFKPNQKQIIIGKGIADALEIRQGDWVSIIIHSDNANCISQQFKHIRLQIAGILQLNSHLDHSFAMVPLDDARSYLGIGNSITGIAIKVNDVFNANNLVFSIRKLIGNYVYGRSWLDTYGYMYRDIQMVRIIIYLAMILVISLSCFNIISVLILITKSKVNDIAVLRMMGAEDNLIHYIFIWYGLLSGLIGNLFGIIIGVIISLKLTVIIHYIERLINYQFLSSNIYFINFLPSKLQWQDVIYVSTFTIFLSLVTSWYPALRATYIYPIKVLNNKH